MGKPFLLQLSSVLVQQRDLLKLGMVIDSYNDHCSAPFSRACWLAYAPPTLLGSGSRHCHGINYTNYYALWRSRHARETSRKGDQSSAPPRSSQTQTSILRAEP